MSDTLLISRHILQPCIPQALQKAEQARAEAEAKEAERQARKEEARRRRLEVIFGSFSLFFCFRSLLQI